jgi:hypothetical protein
MKRLSSLVPALLVVGSLFAGGCVVRGTTGVHAHAYADYTPPQLVYVSPGVQVVYDYDEPVFYSSGYYWRNYGGVWYRSSYHTGGWIRYHAPAAIVRIDRPNYYVRYRGNVTVDHRGRGGGVVRTAPAPRGVYRPAPVVRDNRGGGVQVRDHRTAPPVQVKAKVKAKGRVEVRDRR